MNDFEKQYLYFADESKLNGLPAHPYMLSDGTIVYVHRILGDGYLNWARVYTSQELDKEKQRIISLGIPENEFFAYTEIFERLQEYERRLNDFI